MCSADDTGAGEPELPEVEQTVAVELEQPPAPAQQSARSSVGKYMHSRAFLVVFFGRDLGSSLLRVSWRFRFNR